tara:strand:- start:110 stop:886 length:777 start_codon:yes stop_codon:yes gene_type:complete
MIKNSIEKDFFEKNGYIQLSSKINNKDFDRLCEQIIFETNKFYSENFKKIKNLGGYLTGNLELLPDKKLTDLWNIICDKDFENTFEDITGKKLSNFNIKCSGNVVLPNKGYQHFHTDGPLKSKKIILNLAIHEIDLTNAPTEIIPGTHNRDIKYWKFYLYEIFKKKIFIKMKKGDLIIRNHSIWHRGTKNRSKNLRILLLFALTEKSLDKKFSQELSENLTIGENQFKSSHMQKFKEVFSIYLAPIYIFYRIISSFIK